MAVEQVTDLSRGSLFIGGEWREPRGSDVIQVEDPATERMIGHVPAGTEADVDDAVAAAVGAFPGWSATTVDERRRYLEAFTASLEKRQEELARVVMREMGTPIELSRSVQAGLPVAVLQGFIDVLRTLELTERVGNSLVVKEAAGVVAAITPWNYPIHQAVSKVGAALAAGCPVILKPSQVTPISAYFLAEAAIEAGLPAGVFNLVTGHGRTVGGALAAHPDVDVVSFTGSTGAGRTVAQTAAGTIKRVSLELGGKSANVILPDADLQTAVLRGAEHILENSGQTCTAWSRMIVPAASRDAVIDLVREAFGEVVIGPPGDESTTMGPVATQDQKNVVEQFVAGAGSDGALLVAGDDTPRREVGHYVNPAAFVDVHRSSTLAQEEVFGPVLSILTYETEAEALDIANDSKYGLSGAVWSKDQDHAVEFARLMRTGQVSVNGGSFNVAAPFGGYKQSGVGRELGRHGLDDFLEIKAMQL